MKKKLNIRFPDSLILIVGVMVLVAILTWLLPSGEFERHMIEYGSNGETHQKEVVIPGSYHQTEGSPVNFLEFFVYPLKGIVSAANIVAFILLIGGVFSVINATGAINAGLFKLLEKAEQSPALRSMLIPLLMLVFSLCGATFGMAEETLLFVMVTIPLAKRMGYDEFVGLAIPFLGAGAGFAGAFVNPFTLQIAQGVAELELLSGWEYRIVTWFLFTATAIIFVMRYANKVRKDHIDYNSGNAASTSEELSPSQAIVLILFAVSIVILIIGSTNLDWYIEEISALFLGLAVASALIANINMDDAVASFVSGVKDMVHPALLVGFAKAILLIAEDGQIIDTMLFAVSSSAGDFPSWVNVNIMFGVQSVINFIVPSGSGQAALTMPLMTPLADVLLINRQSAVLAYQFGDGISNMIIPTSGVTMGLLSLAKIEYSKWLKWIMPFFIALNVLALILLTVAELIGVWDIF